MPRWINGDEYARRKHSPLSIRSIKPTSACKQNSKIDRPKRRWQEACLDTYVRQKEKERERTLCFFRACAYIWRDKHFPVKEEPGGFSRRVSTWQQRTTRDALRHSSKKEHPYPYSEDERYNGVSQPRVRHLSSNRVSKHSSINRTYSRREKMSHLLCECSEVNIYRTPTAKCTKGMLYSPIHVEGADAASYMPARSQIVKGNKLRLVIITIRCVFVYSVPP